MKDWQERIQEYREKYPRTWSQQLQRDDSLKEYIISLTDWMINGSRFSERIYNLENNITSYKKCECGRDITNSKARTCKKKGCGAFKKLLNERRDKVKHRQSVKKTYEDGHRKIASGRDRVNISYKNQKEVLDSIDELYSLQETISLLKPVYKRYFGKAGNRTLIKDDPKLYKSLKYHTGELRGKSNTQLRFTGELVFLCEYDGDISRLQCSVNECGDIVSYNPERKKFIKRCNRHYLKYGSKRYFKENYPDNWEEELQKFLSFNNVRYSKISQELFWSIYDYVDGDCYFAELNNEWKYFTNKEQRNVLGEHSKYCFYLDFKYDNKIIEFDGDYWHRETNEYDNVRDSVLIEDGYEVYRVKECDYMENKQKTIEKCVEFLNE